jgi:hypothetical protein
VDNNIFCIIYFAILEMEQNKPKKSCYNKERYEMNKDEILKIGVKNIVRNTIRI